MEPEEEFFIQLFDYERVITMLASMFLNLLIVSAIIVPKFILKRRKDYAISLYLFNFVIFVLGYVLSKTEISFGAGIGLFAVFTMLRFRSEMLNLQDMTYLLIVISIGFVNAAFNGSISFVEIVVLNIGFCIMIYMLDYILAQPKLKAKKIKYGNLELIKPDKNLELLNDLSIQTGLDILKVRIDSIDLNGEVVNIKVYYRDNEKNIRSTKNIVSPFSKLGSLFSYKHVLEKN